MQRDSYRNKIEITGVKMNPCKIFKTEKIEKIPKVDGTL